MKPPSLSMHSPAASASPSTNFRYVSRRLAHQPLQRRVRLQRRRIHGHLAALRQARLPQPPQHPSEHLFVGLQREPLARLRQRRVVRRRFVQSVAQELPQAEAVGGLQRNPSLRLETHQVAQQQHPEIHARRQRRPAQSLIVEAAANAFDKVVEAGLVEHLGELLEERCRRSLGQVVRSQE